MSAFAVLWHAAVLPLALAGLDITPVSAHAFHVSICEIDHNAGAKGLEISFKLFTDDVEEALKAEGAGALHFGASEESKDADRYLSRYLAKHVRIDVDGKPVEWRFIGRENESDAIWCYAEASDISSVKMMTVTDTLLLEAFEDQANLVHVRVNGQRKSLLLNQTKPTDTVSF